MVAGFPKERQHADKTFALDPKGTLYVNVGAPSNSCQEKDRQEGSMGQNPCPILEKYGGVWVFDGNKLDQTPANGRRFATGMRNAVAIEWNESQNALYAVIHGRDSIDTLFPALYNAEDNATRQAEEFHQIVDGGNYGWPYTFFDTKLGKRVVAPEYGGDAKKEPEAGKYPDPLVAFPAHWAPNDLLFYSGKNFPAKYQDGAFIAFHGSWNRAPEPQAGYKVVFQPMKDGKPDGAYEVFADGFAGDMPDNNPRNARYRPVGLAVGSGRLAVRGGFAEGPHLAHRVRGRNEMRRGGHLASAGRRPLAAARSRHARRRPTPARAAADRGRRVSSSTRGTASPATRPMAAAYPTCSPRSPAALGEGRPAGAGAVRDDRRFRQRRTQGQRERAT